MYKITDRQGFSYYMTDANIGEPYSHDLKGVAMFVKDATEFAGWFVCYQDTRLRDKVVIRADEIYLIQEVKHGKG